MKVKILHLVYSFFRSIKPFKNLIKTKKSQLNLKDSKRRKNDLNYLNFPSLCLFKIQLKSFVFKPYTK
jgi:hypothetical protein